MNYYEVWVRSTAYHGTEPLTYHSDIKLEVGSFVQVELQKKLVWAVVIRHSSKPTFKTKPINTASPTLPLPTPLIELGKQIMTFYASNIGSVTQLIVPANPAPLIKDLPATPAQPPEILSLPPLTPEQQSAIKRIDGPGMHLLHGKTGVGKTRVYIELAIQALSRQQSCIILTPEISLTSQLAQRFRSIFGEQVIVLHSGLTPSQRRQAWHQLISNDQPRIVIGARSALFSPLKNVGLIVIDEAHEPAYKQEQAPYYHAVRAASMLSELYKATLVLGTATPSVVDYYFAEQKQRPIITMTSVARKNTNTQNRVVVDLTDKSLFSRSPYLSNTLLEAVRISFSRGEQSMLYLNRRGTARVILCDKCGWQALCPHCDLPLTYHADRHSIHCHSCTYKGSAPVACPECGNPSVVYKSAGTKLIVDEVSRLFPEARIQRFDTDNQKAERFEQHYDAIHRGDVDILVGTQLLAKGLDLPNLSTVGVIMADSGLTMPDFSSGERTFQLLNQVLGRVGRGHRDSVAIIQAYNTTNPAILSAIKDDWHSFYAYELSERQKFMFPPFCFMLKLACRRSTSRAAEKAATDLKQRLESQFSGIIIEGPAPAFHEHVAEKYVWQLVVKTKQRQHLLDIIHNIPSAGWTYDIDPINLL